MSDHTIKPRRRWVPYINVLVFGGCAFDLGLLTALRLVGKLDGSLLGLIGIGFATFAFGLVALLQVRKAETR